MKHNRRTGIITELGDGYLSALGRCFGALGRGFAALFRRVGAAFVFLFSALAGAARAAVSYVIGGFSRLFARLGRGGKAVFGAFRGGFRSGVRALADYIRRSHSLYRSQGKALLNTVLPVLVAVAVILLGMRMAGLTFAMHVTLSDTRVATVRSESDYLAAQREAFARINSADAAAQADPVYTVTLTTAAHLTDTNTICNNIIDTLCDETVSACGVFINGKYLCAVDSVDTLHRVQDRVLSAYAEDMGYVGKQYTVAFDDKIEGVPGIYPAEAEFKTAAELLAYFSGNRKEDAFYTVKKGETLASAVENSGATEAKIRALNPDVDFTKALKEGQKLQTEAAKRNVSIRSTVTRIQTESIPFTTVRQNDGALDLGVIRTIVQGADGQDVVSYTDTYVDGVLTSTDRETVRYNARTAVNELVRVGVRQNSGAAGALPYTAGAQSPRLYKAQGGNFIWPAPQNCFYLSQGYDPGNSHYGIDIIATDDGSCRGRPIVAVADGVVVMATYHWSWGYYIRVDHGDGVVTGYAHALEGSFMVNVGDYVRQGQQLSAIGTTGNSTGYHLHFEVWLDDTRVNPLPYVYDPQLGVTVL